MKVTIVLHGPLKELYSQFIEVQATTFREAITSLQMIPELSPKRVSDRYVCRIDGCETTTDLDAPLETRMIHIRSESVLGSRDITGSGNNPYVRIVIGIVLLVIAFMVFSVSGGGLTQTGMMIASAGISLIAGGIIQILNPIKKDDKSDDDKNRSISDYPNTVRSGTPIPFILGKHKFGGHLFSLNAQSKSSKNLDLNAYISAKNMASNNGSWVNIYEALLTEGNRNKRPTGGRGQPYYDDQIAPN